MVTVDLLYASWIKAPNGASAFVGMLNDKQKYFKENGINITIFSNDMFTPRSFDNKEDIKKKNSFRGCIFKIASRNLLLTILLFYYLNSHSRKLIKKYCHLQRKTDILFFQEVFTCYYFMKYCKHCDSKIMLIKHDNGEDFKMLYYRYPKLNTKLGHLFLNHYIKKTYSEISKFLFVSENSMRTFLNNHGTVPQYKCEFVYNGIAELDSQESQKNNNTIRLVCVGTISDRKNQKMILEALSMLPNDLQKKYSLLLIGDGEGKDNLLELSKSLTSRVEFIGTSTEVEYYLRESSAFILVSKDEGLPISIIEAMRASLPIISTKIAGIPEMVINGKTGFLIDLSLEELINVLKKIPTCDLNQMGRYSYELYKEKFTLDKMISKYINILKNM